MGFVCYASLVLCFFSSFIYMSMLVFSNGGKVEGRKEQKKESGSATAAIRLRSCTWLHWNRFGRCAHPGHLTSGPATAYTASLHLDSAAATSTAAPGSVLPASRSYHTSSSGQCPVLPSLSLPAVSVSIHSIPASSCLTSTAWCLLRDFDLKSPKSKQSIKSSSLGHSDNYTITS